MKGLMRMSRISETPKGVLETYDWQDVAEDLQERIEKAIEYINNFDVFKKFSFPLMKKWEENQVKSSIDYEFNDSLKKDLLKILNGGKNE